MNFATLGVFLPLGFVSLGLLLYCRQRNKQRRPAAINQEMQAKNKSDAAEDLAYVDNFYCIMLSDGTCRSGHMPETTPDIPARDGIFQSESRLGDGLTQLEKPAHPARHPSRTALHSRPES